MTLPVASAASPAILVSVRGLTNYVPIEWDAAVPLDEPLPIAALKREIPDARIWHGTPLNWDRLERTGVHIHDDTADAIEPLWAAHLAAYHNALTMLCWPLSSLRLSDWDLRTRGGLTPHPLRKRQRARHE